jgi:hypothetical protein
MATNSSRKSRTTTTSRQNKSIKIAGRRRLATQGSESSTAKQSARPIGRAGGNIKVSAKSAGQGLLKKVSGARQKLQSALALGKTRSKTAR